jgi:hypothetical protein
LAIRLEELIWAWFEQGIKWDAPLGLDLGLGLWRLHTMAIQVERPWEFMAKGLNFGLGLWKLHTLHGCRIHFLYFIGYFQLISLDSQQSLASQSHGLLTWTAIVWSGPKLNFKVISQGYMLGPPRQYLVRFLDMIRRDLSVSKSNRFPYMLTSSGFSLWNQIIFARFL